MPKPNKKHPVLDAVDANLPGAERLDDEKRQRLLGRYGADAPALVEAAAEGELERIADTDLVWAELRWAARAEGVVHLDDLLLRRVRLGLLTRQGGRSIMERVRGIVQPELGWDDARWEQEVGRYADLWDRCYSVPEGLPAVIETPAIQLGEDEVPSPHEPEPRLVLRKSQPAYRIYLGLGLLLALTLLWFLKERRNDGDK
jgi:hypothetical protein